MSTVSISQASLKLQEGQAFLLSDPPEIAKAITCFSEAVKLDSNDSRIFISLASALNEAGHLTESVKRFREGLALKPHYGEADARVMLARVLKKLGKKDEAIAEWRTVANMKGMYPSYAGPINEAKTALKEIEAE